MLALLRFLPPLEFVIYALLALGVLANARRIALARGELRKTIFGLEREALDSRQTRASLTIALLSLAGGLVFAAVNLALPSLERAELVRTTGSSEPQPTPSPTAFVLFGVDLSGCANPRATITSPTPGQAVQGDVELRGSALRGRPGESVCGKRRDEGAGCQGGEKPHGADDTADPSTGVMSRRPSLREPR